MSSVFFDWMTCFRPVSPRMMRLSGFSITRIGRGGHGSLGSTFPPCDWIALSRLRKEYAYNRISAHANRIKPGELYYHTKGHIFGGFLARQYLSPYALNKNMHKTGFQLRSIGSRQEGYVTTHKAIHKTTPGHANTFILHTRERDAYNRISAHANRIKVVQQYH